MPEPEPVQLHEALLWSWVLVWPVVAVLPDVACEPTLLPCVTEPSLPGLSTPDRQVGVRRARLGSRRERQRELVGPGLLLRGLDARAARV